MEKIVIVGMGGHALNVIETIERCGLYRIAGYTDFHVGTARPDLTWLGTDDELETLFQNGCKNAVVTVGQIGPDKIRHKLYDRCRKIGYCMPAIIDDTAVVAASARISDGCYIGKTAVVNSGAAIGKMSIINNGAIIEHGNTIGEYCHVAVHATLCGDVTVGENTFIGASATIIQGVSVGRDCIIGAGSLVRHPVLDGEKVYGVV